MFKLHQFVYKNRDAFINLLFQSLFKSTAINKTHNPFYLYKMGLLCISKSPSKLLLQILITYVKSNC